MNYQKWKAATTKLATKLPVPPYHSQIELTEYGGIRIEEIELQPEEAVRLAKWILDFYQPY